jgi:hypothetical protein
MRNNKVATYLLYAVGEIILVVLGILIALYLDNLNAEQKSNDLKQRYKAQLKSDLVADTVFINNYLKYIDETMAIWQKLKERIVKPTATIDTLLNIHKNEFEYFYNVIPGFHRNTYTAIQATGNWDVFEDSLVNEISGFYILQEVYLNDIRLNEEPYNKDVLKLLNRFPIDEPFAFVGKGPLYDELWDSAHKIEYIAQFNAMATSRGLYFYFSKERLLSLKEETVALLIKL